MSNSKMVIYEGDTKTLYYDVTDIPLDVEFVFAIAYQNYIMGVEYGNSRL